MKFHNVQQIDFEGPHMVLKADDQLYRIDLASVSERLAKASEDARRSYSVSPSGYGIHWPDIDEDLTVDGLIESTRHVQSKIGTPVLLKEEPPR